MFTTLLLCSQVDINLAKTSKSGGSESFTNSNATTSYADGSFAGDGGITWNYFQSRDQDTMPINGKGLMLRKPISSKLQSGTISGGIASFQLKMRKAFTGDKVRQLELYINGELKGTSQTFGSGAGADATIHTFSVSNINVPGDFVMMIKGVGNDDINKQVVIDDISWTGYENTDPYININTPENNSTIFGNSVSIDFRVLNFTIGGSNGKVKCVINGGTPEYYTTSPISKTNLTSGTYAVVLELVNNDNSSLVPAASATVNFTIDIDGPDYTKIYNIQYTTNTTGDSPLLNNMVWVKGVVSANFNGTTNGKGYYLQQGGGAWNSIYIFDETNSPSIGDSVRVYGKVMEYFKFTQIGNISQYEVFDIEGTVALPIELTTQEAKDEKYESCLVKVINASCKTVINNYGIWTVNNINGGASSGDLNCKRNDRNIDFTPVVGTSYDIIGVIDYLYDAFNLQYRILSDIIVHGTGADVGQNFANQVQVYPNPATEYVNVNLVGGADKISILNMIGGKVIELNDVFENQKINIENLESGIYFIEITRNSNVATLKFVVR